ncbi:endonuclease/exonuclease/phosphatase family protein [Rhodopila sp.]|uniref:endonuclease/exonuclease/phosphatase family protein n=1 Tax=Rhodopila sp. TaxID=2480087 RepID=UPI003D09F482
MKSVLMLLVLLLPLRAVAAELKIATWNLDWLTTRAAGDHSLPSDVTPRSDADFDRLAQYAQKLDADLIAIEEVDGFRAASKVFPHDRYSIHMTHDHVVQRVGIVVRRGLKYDVNPDVAELGEHHLRSGADITLHLGGFDLRVLAVHLKKGCRDIPLTKATGHACEELRDQVPVLADWITARREDGVPFLVLGDFNRWMDSRDTMLADLRQAAPLVRATEGQSSPCWGGENFIDHILAGGAAAQWMRPNTLQVLTYSETDRAMKDRLSDHCPVSVRLAVPEASGVSAGGG